MSLLESMLGTSPVCVIAGMGKGAQGDYQKYMSDFQQYMKGGLLHQLDTPRELNITLIGTS